MRTFQQILEAAGYETGVYIGLGLGGPKCLSVGLPGDGQPGRLFADVARAAAAPRNGRRDLILYNFACEAYQVALWGVS